MLDSAQCELGNAPVQREVSELRLRVVGRSDFHVPVAEVLNEPTQVQPDLHVLCWGTMIVVE